MNPLVDGLRISLIGLLLVFLALGLLTMLLVVLQGISNQLLRAQERGRRIAPPVAAEDASGGAEDELAWVAAIAVALIEAQRAPRRDQSLGELLHRPRSSALQDTYSALAVEGYGTEWPRIRQSD